MTELSNLGIALAIGLLVGLEREFSLVRRESGRPADPARRPLPAGVRSFPLIALAGAIAIRLGQAAFAAGLVAVAALLLVGYVRSSAEDFGVTSELAALVTYLLGAFAKNEPTISVAVAVLVAVLLASKGPIHYFARQWVTADEMSDALKMFVVAFVVLPLMPNRGIGPDRLLNPHRLWELVVLLAGVGWLGHLLVRVLGAGRGLTLAGLAGGLISASATTASMARLQRDQPRLLRSSLGATVAASVATVAQLALVSGVAGGPLLGKLTPGLLVGGVWLVAAAVLLAGRDLWSPRVASERSEAPGMIAATSGRAFRLAPALLLAVLLTAVRLGAGWASKRFGQDGAIIAGALGGFADTHGTVLALGSLVADGQLGVRSGVLGTVAAVSANTTTKVILVCIFGGRRFAWRATLLLAPPFFLLGAIALLGAR